MSGEWLALGATAVLGTAAWLRGQKRPYYFVSMIVEDNTPIVDRVWATNVQQAWNKYRALLETQYLLPSGELQLWPPTAFTAVLDADGAFIQLLALIEGGVLVDFEHRPTLGGGKTEVWRRQTVAGMPPQQARSMLWVEVRPGPVVFVWLDRGRLQEAIDRALAGHDFVTPAVVETVEIEDAKQLAETGVKPVAIVLGGRLIAVGEGVEKR